MITVRRIQHCLPTTSDWNSCSFFFRLFSSTVRTSSWVIQFLALLLSFSLSLYLSLYRCVRLSFSVYYIFISFILSFQMRWFIVYSYDHHEFVCLRTEYLIVFVKDVLVVCLFVCSFSVFLSFSFALMLQRFCRLFNIRKALASFRLYSLIRIQHICKCE